MRVCAAVTFCMPTTSAQLVTRLVPLQRGLFGIVCVTFWVLGVLWLVPDSIGIKMPDALANAWTALWVVAMFAMCLVTCAVRSRVREAEKIESSCGPCDGARTARSRFSALIARNARCSAT